jgi:hypothetical protein
MKVLLSLFLLFPFLQCHSQKSESNGSNKIVFDLTDSIRYGEIISRMEQQGTLSANKLFLEIALAFVGTPYAAATLEGNDDELLVVNLREFDCTTFIETCLALTLAIQTEDRSFDRFTKNLKKIRYRNGQIDGYTSRLHYFNEWIKNNEQKGFIANLTCKLFGEPFEPRLNFMSSHPNAYPQLKQNSTLIPVIAAIEDSVSQFKGCFIPKEQVKEIEQLIEPGSIIGITTTIEGLDFVHTGISIHKNGRLHLLHASSEEKIVTISTLPLHEYLEKNKRQSGIVVVVIP